MERVLNRLVGAGPSRNLGRPHLDGQAPTNARLPGIPVHPVDEQTLMAAGGTDFSQIPPTRIYRQKAGAAPHRAAKPKGRITYAEDPTYKAAKLSTETQLFARAYVTGSKTGAEVVQYLESHSVNVKVHFVATNEDLPDKDPTAAGSHKRVGPGEFEAWVSSGYRAATTFGGPENVRDRDPDSVAKILLHELLHVWFETKFPGRGTGHTGNVGPVVEAFGITTYEKEEAYEEEFLAYLKRFDVELREELQRERRQPESTTPGQRPPPK